MQSALITTVEQVRANGVRINFINEDSEIADMISAQQMFIEPVLGKEMYEDLFVEPAAFNDLMPYILRALAPLAYWLDLPNLHTQITDKGIATSSSENLVSARKWEYEEAREGLAEKGCFHLEKLIEFISIPEIAAGYQWSVPDEYDLIFRTGIEFNKYFTLYQPYRTFLNLRPFVKEAEDQFIRPTIGDDFFEEMRDIVLPDKKINRNTTQEIQYKALQQIKKTTAFYTIAKAVDQLPVKISTNGFTVSLRDAVDKPNPQDQQAPKVQLDNLRTSAQNTADNYLLKLSDYLNANADVFPTYKDSEFYEAPVTGDDTDINSCQNIFSL